MASTNRLSTKNALTLRLATEADLPAVVQLLAADPLGIGRELFADPLPDAYRSAFAAMQAQRGNELLLAVLHDTVVGCVQLTIIPGISRLGTTRAQIEGVRVAADQRGAGAGEWLIRAAIERARAGGCGLVQLTTDNTRADAQRFYERLGFEATHIGMKMQLHTQTENE